jgi:mono/diheme cytochrome c family protein
MTLAAGGEMPETPTLLRTSDYVREFPLPLTSELVLHGQERFRIYCAPCHGKDATGGGPVVEHGFPRPPSLHSATLKNAPAGYSFDVVSRGLRDMPEFRNRIPLRDRWAVVAYVRAMQQAGSAKAGDAELIAAAKGLAVAEGTANDEALRQKNAVPTDAGSGRAVPLNMGSESDLGVRHAASN